MTHTLRSAWIEAELFERVCLAFEALGYEPPRPSEESEENATGARGEHIVEQYGGRLSETETLDIIAYGLLSDFLMLRSLRNKRDTRNKHGNAWITLLDIAGLSEVFRERVSLPGGITLWGINNGGPVLYRSEHVINITKEQAQRLFAIMQRLHEQVLDDLDKRLEQQELKAFKSPTRPNSDWYCQECGHSSKKSSVLLHTLNILVSAENDNPRWMDYQRCKHLLTILYLLRLRIGGYLSTIGSNLSHGHAFTQATVLAWNPQT